MRLAAAEPPPYRPLRVELRLPNEKGNLRGETKEISGEKGNLRVVGRIRRTAALELDDTAGEGNTAYGSILAGTVVYLFAFIRQKTKTF
jgi:hypothetical protein